MRREPVPALGGAVSARGGAAAGRMRHRGVSPPLPLASPAANPRARGGAPTGSPRASTRPARPGQDGNVCYNAGASHRRIREEVAWMILEPAASMCGPAPAGGGALRTPEQLRQRTCWYEPEAWGRPPRCGARGWDASDAPPSPPPHRGGPGGASPSCAHAPPRASVRGSASTPLRSWWSRPPEVETWGSAPPVSRPRR